MLIYAVEVGKFTDLQEQIDARQCITLLNVLLLIVGYESMPLKPLVIKVVLPHNFLKFHINQTGRMILRKYLEDVLNGDFQIPIVLLHRAEQLWLPHPMGHFQGFLLCW